MYPFLIALSFVCTTFASPNVAMPVTKNLPHAEVNTLDRETKDIYTFLDADKLTIISFWATWCVNCKKELDTVAELYPEWQEKYGINLIAITIDDQRSLPKVPGVVQAKSWEYIILADPAQNLKNALNFQAIPQTYLVNSQGEILYERSGFSPGHEYELEEAIEAALEK